MPQAQQQPQFLQMPQCPNQVQQQSSQDGQNNLPVVNLPLQEPELVMQEQEASTSPKTPQYPGINIGRMPIIDTRSPSSIISSPHGEGLTKPDLNKSEPFVKNSGPPLASFFLDKITSSSTATTADDATIVPESRDLPLHPLIKDPEAEMQVNIESDANVKRCKLILNQENAAPEEEEFGQFKQPQSRTPLSTPADSSVIEGANPPIDWDSEENWQRRMFHEIRAAKKERHDELLLIDQKMQELNEEKQRIVQIRHDLETREAKLIEIEPLIPSARQLEGHGITLEWC
jgi:hypothetical protein